MGEVKTKCKDSLLTQQKRSENTELGPQENYFFQ